MFTVAAGFNLFLGEKKLETLSFRIGDTEVKLTKDDCKELMNVLSGKCHKICAFESEDSYQAHSVLLFSNHDEKQTELTVHTEKSLAVF